MITVAIDTATTNDLDAILALERAGFPAAERWSAVSWRSELTLPAVQVLVARDDRVRGTIALRFGPDSCDLDRIVVDHRLRRQGIGRSLLAAGLDLAGHRGCAEMILEVRAGNLPAIGLYRLYGFGRLAVRNDYYGPGRHAMIMTAAVGGQHDE